MSTSNEVTADVAALRREYRLASLDVGDVRPDPVDEFTLWFEQARRSGLVEPNAMTLATVDAAGRPDARMVLLKGFDRRGFLFFTNYDSQKGAQLAANPRACLVFYWDVLERQVRITGAVIAAERHESEAYFRVRPRESQLGAWASPQSVAVPDRATLERAFEAARQRFEGRDVECPARWGGYRVRHETVEFWQGRGSRLHDRVRYVREGEAWRRERLAP